MDEIRLQKLAELGDDVEEHLIRLNNRRGLPSIPWLDAFEPEMLWIHGAYTGHAKTLFTLNCAFYWSTVKAAPLNVCFITLEEGLKNLDRKINRIGIPRPGRLTLVTNAGLLLNLEDYLEDTDILIVDSLNLLPNFENIGYGKQNMAANLKAMARKKKIGILTTTRTSRHGYARIRNRTFHQFTPEEFRPTEMESADIVTAIWKDDINPDTLELQWVKHRTDTLPDPIKLPFHGNGVIELGA